MKGERGRTYLEIRYMVILPSLLLLFLVVVSESKNAEVSVWSLRISDDGTSRDTSGLEGRASGAEEQVEING